MPWRCTSCPITTPCIRSPIIPRGRAAGMTVSLPEEESSHLTRNEMYEDIVAGLGGRVAEALFCQGYLHRRFP